MAYLGITSTSRMREGKEKMASCFPVGQTGPKWKKIKRHCNRNLGGDTGKEGEWFQRGTRHLNLIIHIVFITYFFSVNDLVCWNLGFMFDRIKGNILTFKILCFTLNIKVLLSLYIQKKGFNKLKLIPHLSLNILNTSNRSDMTWPLSPWASNS